MIDLILGVLGFSLIIGLIISVAGLIYYEYKDKQI